MKIAVYDDFQLGAVDGEMLYPIGHLLPRALDAAPDTRVNWLARHWNAMHPDVVRQRTPVPVTGVKLRACSPAPRHVFALPGNYRAHLGEIGAMTVSGKRTANEMGFFLKAPGSLAGAGDAIELPPGSARRFDHECELAVIIGAPAFEVPAGRAAEVVFGYACAIDVTMRIDPGNREEDRSMRKSFKTFTPLGPFLATADEVGDPHELRSHLRVNGEERQSAFTGDMIVNVWQAIELISSVVPLSPGDVILTGTPAGVGPLRAGDEVEIGIERVGSMRLPVTERKTIPPRVFLGAIAMTITLPATFMRGGTSKALMFRRDDLPADRADWDDLLLRAMGSPDPYGRQLNGMGGGLSSLSKVCVIGVSERASVDLDFTFAQVQIRRAMVDYTGNCGNMSAAVAPFGLAAGLIKRGDGNAAVLVHNTNTGKLMRASFKVGNGFAIEEGDLVIPGVGGSGAPVRLDFLEPGGPASGSLLPTGRATDELVTPLGAVTVSMIDAANACVFVAASDVGLTGTEQPEQIESRPDVLEALATIRAHAAVAMGLVTKPEEAASRPMTPFVAVLAPPCRYVASDRTVVEAADYDLGVRFVSNGQPHRAIPGTGALCVAVAARITESIAGTLARAGSRRGATGLGLGTPAGVVSVDALVERSTDGGWSARSATSYRTFRRLFTGEVFA